MALRHEKCLFLATDVIHYKNKRFLKSNLQRRRGAKCKRRASFLIRELRDTDETRTRNLAFICDAIITWNFQGRPGTLDLNDERGDVIWHM